MGAEAPAAIFKNKGEEEKKKKTKKHDKKERKRRTFDPRVTIQVIQSKHA